MIAAYTIVLMFAMLFVDSILYSQPPTYIFDWRVQQETQLKMLGGTWPSQITPIPNHYRFRLAGQSLNPKLHDGLETLRWCQHNNRPVGCMLNFHAGSYFPRIDRPLEVIDCITTANLQPDFVFADIEIDSPSTPNENEIVLDRILNHVGNSAGGKLAKVGAYRWYPGSYDKSFHFAPKPKSHGGYQTAVRDKAHRAYLDRDFMVAMPNCYAYSALVRHAKVLGLRSANRVSPNIRSGLFWAQVERASSAKSSLRPGQLLIPFISGFGVTADSGSNLYHCAPPTRSDMIATIQHLRLRGADGYYRFSHFFGRPEKRDPITHAITQRGDWFHSTEHGESYFQKSWLANYTQERNAADLFDGWSALDPWFGTYTTGFHSSQSEVRDTFIPGAEGDKNYAEKKSGVIYSGRQHQNDVLVLISNLSNQNWQVKLPDLYDFDRALGLPIIPGLTASDDRGEVGTEPEFSSEPTSPQHQFITHKIVNLVKNGDFENKEEGWHTNLSAITENGGTDGSAGMQLTGQRQALVLDQEHSQIKLTPGTPMKVFITARGANSAIELVFNYWDKKRKATAQLHVQNWQRSGPDSSDKKEIADSPAGSLISLTRDFRTYVATFSVPSNSDGKIYPSFYRRLLNTSQSEDGVSIIDDFVLKYDDQNLIVNGDFDNGSADWILSNGATIENLGVAGTPAMNLGMGSSVQGSPFGFGRPAVAPGSRLKLSFQYKGVGKLLVNMYKHHADGIRFSPPRVDNDVSNFKRVLDLTDLNSVGPTLRDQELLKLGLARSFRMFDSFKKIEVEFAVPADTYFISPIFYQFGQGNLVLDDVKIEADDR